MPEVITESPVQEQSHADKQLGALVNEQVPLSVVLEKLNLGELPADDIIDTLTSLRQLIEIRADVNFPHQYGFALDIEESLLALKNDALGRKETDHARCHIRPGGWEYTKVKRNLENESDLSKAAQARLVTLCDKGVALGLIKPNEPLPSEISQNGVMQEIVSTAYAIMQEVATMHEVETSSPDATLAVQNVFNRVNDQLSAGQLRVFLTNGERTSFFRREGSLGPERSINLRAEDGDNFGSALRGYLKNAGINIKKVEAQTGLTMAEMGLRFVAMHELGHALQLSTSVGVDAIHDFLADHPEDAVSTNFEDSVHAEKERFAEGLAIYYLRHLLVSSGFDDQPKIDKVVDSIQAGHLISNQEWYAQAAVTDASLGHTTNSNRTSANGANLGYGLHLDTGELLERFSYVANTLAYGKDTAGYHKMFEKTDEHGIKDWWKKFLEEKNITLPPVHEAAAIAADLANAEKEHVAKIESRERKLRNFNKVGYGVIMGLLTSLGIITIAGEDKPPVPQTVIQTGEGHTLKIEEVMADGNVIFEMSEPANPEIMAARLQELDRGNVVIGKDEAGDSLYIAQPLIIPRDDNPNSQLDLQSIDTTQEVFKRLPADLQARTARPGKEQDSLLKLIHDNTSLSILGKDVLVIVESIRLDNLIEQLRSGQH